MVISHIFFFAAYPYIALSLFFFGHIYRYHTGSFSWNAHSSEFLEKKTAFYGATIFHWGIILTLIGHAGGLLIPQIYYNLVGISAQAHTRFAIIAGIIVGAGAFFGLLLILMRRFSQTRILHTTPGNHFLTLTLLLLTIGTGFYNVVFGRFHVLDTVAPWIQGIVTLRPDPELMLNVPFSYKIHIILAFALVAFSPFSRLVHIWSAPLPYLFRRFLIFRRAWFSENSSGQ